MAALVRRAAEDSAGAEPGRRVRVEIGPLPRARGDEPMLAQVWANLLANAYKYTRPRADAVVEVGGASGAGRDEYWVKDNGVGFDPRHVDKLFAVFSRLHGADEFEGTGVGLALVKRIVERHGGSVSAEGRVDGGALFRFTLPQRSDS
jgi:signal transduction histidine kinase